MLLRRLVLAGFAPFKAALEDQNESRLQYARAQWLTERNRRPATAAKPLPALKVDQPVVSILPTFGNTFIIKRLFRKYSVLAYFYR